MRGKQRRLRRFLGLDRFIPAHAGKTPSAISRSAAAQVHPRACGENLRILVPPRARPGSSPRMRGKLCFILKRGFTGGFIPAHAGKTSRSRRLVGRDPVHPRACGENSTSLGASTNGTGSSPRMRGKPPNNQPKGKRYGFIPAHAGKTGAHSGLPPVFSGSSPRMRGKHRQPGIRWTGAWFIPAHAGKTAGSQSSVTRRRVHPRACGENGSSRRGRQQGSRFIPAHAGKTTTTVSSSKAPQVHPRACGENRRGSG